MARARGVAPRASVTQVQTLDGRDPGTRASSKKRRLAARLLRAGKAISLLFRLAALFVLIQRVQAMFPHYFTKYPSMEFVPILIEAYVILMLPGSSHLKSLRDDLTELTSWVAKRLFVAFPEWFRPRLVDASVVLAGRCFNSSLTFFALNFAVAGIPQYWQVALPQNFRFLDINDDGYLSAYELETWFSGISTEILGSMLSLHCGRFLLQIKETDEEKVPDPKNVPVTGVLGFILRFFYVKQNRVKERDLYLQFQLLDRMLSILISTLAVYPWLSVFGLNLQTVLALGGVGGLAVGLAAQDLVGNFISGVLIYVNQRFSEGDEIETENRSIRGIVENVGLTYTTVNQIDGMPIQVPNSMILNHALVNRSTKFFRKIEHCLEILLPDVGKLPQLIIAVDKTLQEHPDVLTQQKILQLKRKFAGKLKAEAPIVCYEGVSELGFRLFCRAYVAGRTKDNDFRRIQSNVLLAVNQAVVDFGGAFSFRATASVPTFEKQQQQQQQSGLFWPST